LPVGSRIFLFKQGEKSKGIITLSEPKEEPHFNPNLAKKGKDEFATGEDTNIKDGQRKVTGADS